jgi:LysR family transcriptional regulator, carnitine catabolism transcriptional activator
MITRRSLALKNFWNWLPTFRVVAERESIQAASDILHVSASAVSRTIRLLEDEVGHALFLRAGGHLRLSCAGKDLLEAVRRSMTLMDEGVSALDETGIRGPFTLSMGRDLSARLGLPSLGKFQARWPARSLSLLHGRCSEASARLMDGSIDVAVLSQPPQARAGHVELHRLGTLELSVYCGVGHPLHGTTDSRWEMLFEYRFIHSADDTSDLVGNLPPELLQRVSLELADASGVLEACASGLGLAVLPVCMANPEEEAGRLWRLRGPVLADVALYAIRRPILAAGDMASVMLKCLEEVAASLLAPPMPGAFGTQKLAN